MFLRSFIFIIFWAFVCFISAPTSPSLAQDATPIIKNVQQESARLYTYIQLIKNIDIEESMETVVELMHTLRILFPARFAKFKLKIYNMYDPLTDRNFGVAFQAFMNIIRVKANRDKLHSIFDELTVPEVHMEQMLQSSQPETTQPAIKKIELPIRYKLVDQCENTTSRPPTAKNHPLLERSPPGKLRAADARPSSSSSVMQPAVRKTIPTSLTVQPGDENVVTKLDSLSAKWQKVKESGQVQHPGPQTRVLHQRMSENSATPAGIQDDSNVELENMKAAENRVVRLKNLLERVKTNQAASAKFQGRAALLSQALSKPNASNLLKGGGKIIIPRV